MRPLPHLRAFRAKTARLRVVGFFDLASFCSFFAGIFWPFFAPAVLRSLPRLLGLILMGFFRLATTTTSGWSCLRTPPSNRADATREQLAVSTPSATRRFLSSTPMRILLFVVIAVGLVYVVPRLGGTASTTATQPSAPVKVSPVAGQIPSGVWLVGVDVQPGTYRSTGSEGRYCMWSRHSSHAGGPMDNIIASDGRDSGQMVVTIQPGDALFRTNGCAPFTKI